MDGINGAFKIGKAVVKSGQAFIKCGLKSASETFRNEYHGVSADEKQQISTEPVQDVEIYEQESIKKVLSYLLLPVSKAQQYKSFDELLDWIVTQKQNDGGKTVHNYMANKYCRTLERLSENLKLGNREVSLSILNQITDSIKEDKKTLLN